MSLKAYSLHEITDSRIIYDKKPPRFMIFIIFVVIALITAFLIWANHSIKTYVVRGQGIVTSEDKANIMASISGSIQQVNIKEGQDVEKGDVLFTINPLDSNLQLSQINQQLEFDNNRISFLERAENDATNNKNSFDRNKPNESEFYNRLENSYTKKKEFAVNVDSLRKQGYNDDQINEYKNQQNVKIKEIYYDTINSFTSEKIQYQSEKSKLEAQKLMYEKSMDAYKVIAPESGKIHLSTQITEGMVLQTGNLLGSIANNKKDLTIEVTIPSSDRPLIQIGDEVSLAVAGLNQMEYGTIKGKVVNIDEDANIDSQKGNVYFRVKVKPNETYLEDKKGEKVNLTLGMVTETRVKYEKITYMKYILEQIGVKFN